MKRNLKNIWALFTAGALIRTVSCSDDETPVSLSNVSMPEMAEPVAITCDEILTGTFSHSFTLTLDQPAAMAVMGDIRVDEESRVDAYNAEHGTNYEILPSNIYEILYNNFIIAAGETESNVLTIDFSGTLMD